MSETTETTSRPWHQLAAAERPTLEATAAFYAVMAQAHLDAFTEAVTSTDGPQGMRGVLDAHFHPFTAAFTAAALAKGWTTERVYQALCDGDTAGEFIGEWLSDAGVDWESITPLTILADAEKRGAVKTLRRCADATGARIPALAEAVSPDRLSELSGVVRDMRDLADRIESGEATP